MQTKLATGTEFAGATPELADKSVGTGTLGKALQVLDIIAMSPVPLRFTDVLERTDQPRGTLHRQLSNLIEEGLHTVNADNSYALGLRFLKLAAKSWSRNTLRIVAEPFIRELHEQTGETVHLGVIRDLEVIYIDKLESKQSVRMHSQVGNASPLYCTGIGKAMLARLPDEECEARARRFAFLKFTDTTLVTPQMLLAEIAEIRKTGIAHDREEHEPGIRCVAAALGDAKHSTIAGISVTAPAYRLGKTTIRDWEKLVLEKVRQIELVLEDHLGPRYQE